MKFNKIASAVRTNNLKDLNLSNGTLSSLSNLADYYQEKTSMSLEKEIDKKDDSE